MAADRNRFGQELARACTCCISARALSAGSVSSPAWDRLVDNYIGEMEGHSLMSLVKEYLGTLHVFEVQLFAHSHIVASQSPGTPMHARNMATENSKTWFENERCVLEGRRLVI